MATNTLLSSFTCPNRCINLQERASWLALRDVLEGHKAGYPLPLPTLRAVVLAKTLLENGEATVEEMEPFIGSRWALCRPTPANRARHGNCLTSKQYEEAKRKAINARVDRLMAELTGEKMQEAA